MSLDEDVRAGREKVAVVTGGTRGIGRAAALGLAEAGAHVVVVREAQDHQAWRAGGSLQWVEGSMGFQGDVGVLSMSGM